MSLRHQRSAYRYHVDRFVLAELPTAWGLRGLDVGGPSPQGHSPMQAWESVNCDLAAKPDWLCYAEDLGMFPDAEFDIVQATDMLYLVANVPMALGEMHRVLAPGGTLLATVATDGTAGVVGLVIGRGASAWDDPTAAGWID